MKAMSREIKENIRVLKRLSAEKANDDIETWEVLKSLLDEQQSKLTKEQTNENV